MQACKLSIPEARPSQVVKAVVDVPSQCAALLLSDSSCVLLPSLFGNSPPLVIPSPCSDICFLRLCERSLSSSSSSSLSERSAVTIGSEQRSISHAKEEAGTAGPSGSVSNNGHLFIVTSFPSKAGSCTGMRSWSWKESAFSKTQICLEGHVNSQLPIYLLQFDDIPHSIAVHIAASVNVVVVYSPSANKVWILSAKLSVRGKEEGSGRIPRSTEVAGPLDHSRKTVATEDAANSSHCIFREQQHQENDKQICLKLIKCAVLDCKGPVYALHLSLQHLLLGQVGGVRLCALRPLIKGSRSRRRDLKSDIQHSSKGNCMCNVGVSLGGKAESRRNENHVYDLIPGDIIGCEETGFAKEEVAKASARVIGPKNGIYESEKDANVPCIAQVMLKHNGVCANLDGCKSQSICGTNFTCKRDANSNCLVVKGNGCRNSSNDADNGVLDTKCRSLNAPKAMAATETGHVSNRRYEVRLEEACRLEEWHGHLMLSQSSLFSSSSSSSSSCVAPGPICSRATGLVKSSCHSFTSCSPSVTGSPDNPGVSKVLKRILEGRFIWFPSHVAQNGESATSTGVKRAEQAVSIHPLSEREFLVLDSGGKMHLLNLQHLDTTCLQGTSRVLASTTLQTLMCAIDVKMLVGHPVSTDVGVPTAPASRVLWISDGSHGLYAIALPIEEKGKKADLFKPSHCTVVQAVFTVDRISCLSALSWNTVMVMTEGSTYVYSLVGA